MHVVADRIVRRQPNEGALGGVPPHGLASQLRDSHFKEISDYYIREYQSETAFQAGHLTGNAL